MEEIDLRAYVVVLMRWWWRIAAVAALSALIGLAISFALPPSYQAQAIVAVTAPQSVASFDPRFETVGDWESPYRALPILATSDGVLTALRAAMEAGEGASEPDSLAGLQGMVEAKSASDPSLVLLRVRSGSARQAADVANAWADVFVVQARQIYGRSGEELAYFEGQLAQSEANLAEVEEALVAFQQRNQGPVLQIELDNLRTDQADYLAERTDIQGLIRDIEGLQTQLTGYAGTAPAWLGDALTTLLLEVTTFVAGESTPIQLQLDSAEALLDRSVGELRAFLQELSSTLQERSSTIESLLAEIEPQILDRQQQIQGYQNEEDRLLLTRDVAEETYLILARKVEETRLLVESPSSEVRLLSRAAVPERPAGPRKLLNTLIAGVLGGIFGVAGAFVHEWWRQGQQAPVRDSD